VEAVRVAPVGVTQRLQPGRYALSLSLLLERPIRLEGAGMDATEIVCQAEGRMVRSTGNGLFAARDLTFRHLGDPPSQGGERR